MDLKFYLLRFCSKRMETSKYFQNQSNNPRRREWIGLCWPIELFEASSDGRGISWAIFVCCSEKKNHLRNFCNEQIRFFWLSFDRRSSRVDRSDRWNYNTTLITDALPFALRSPRSTHFIRITRYHDPLNDFFGRTDFFTPRTATVEPIRRTNYESTPRFLSLLSKKKKKRYFFCCYVNRLSVPLRLVN